MTFSTLVKRPSALLPIAMSLAALLLAACSDKPNPPTAPDQRGPPTDPGAVPAPRVPPLSAVVPSTPYRSC